MKIANNINDLKEYRVSSVSFKDGKFYGLAWSRELRDYDAICEVNMPLIDIFLEKYNPESYSFSFDDTLLPLFDDNFIKENVEVIVQNYEILHKRSPEFFSEIIFEYCFEHKLFDYIFRIEFFDSLMYDKMLEIAKEDEEHPIFEDIEAFALDFIEKAPVDTYHKYSGSFIIASCCLDNDRIDLFDKFSSTVKRSFTEEYLASKYELFYDFYSKEDDVPDFLNDKKSFFDFVLERGNIGLLSDFQNDFLDNDIVANNIDIFTKRIADKGYVPIALRDKEVIMDYLFNSGKYDSILKNRMMPKLEYFDKDDFYNYFMSLYDINDCENNREILYYFLEKKEFKFAFTRFSSSLFDLETAKKFPEMFTCSDSFFLRNRVDFGYELFKYYLEKDNFFDLPVSFFTDDDLYNAMIEYPNQMLALILENPEKFRNNYSAFTFLLEEKKFADAVSFSSDLFGEELLEEFGDDVLTWLETQEYISPCFNNDVIFNYALQKGNVGVLLKFKSDYLTDEVCHKYAKEILEHFENEFPYDFKNTVLFEKAIELGYYKLASSFPDLPEELIDKYFDIFVSNANCELSYRLKNNKYFADLCIQKKIPNIFDCISVTFITDEIVSENEETIKNVLMGNEENKNIYLSSSVFKYALTHDMVYLLDKFSFNACDEEFVANNLDLLNSAIKDTLPNVLIKNVDFLKYCIDHNRTDLVMSFYYSAYDALDKDYLDKLSTQLSVPFTGYIDLSSNLLKYFLDKKDLTYINEFRDALFGCTDNIWVEYFFGMDELDAGKDLLVKYFKDIYFYSLDNGVPKPLKGNKYFVTVLLQIGKYELLDQFDQAAWPTYLDDNMCKKIFDYIEKNNGVVPHYLVSNNFLRKKVFDLGKYDLFLQFILNVKSEEMLKLYAKQMNLDYDKFKETIDELMTRNDELYDTVLPRMFEERMKVISIKQLEKIMLYPELQSKIINMSDAQLKVMSKVFDLFDVDDYDLSGTIVSIVNNLPKHNDLVMSVDIDNMSNDQLMRLFTVITRKDNLYGITNADQLEKSNYAKAKRNYFSKITKKIKSNKITILELKEALLQKKYGLSMEQTEFLVQRYCHSLDLLKKGNFDNKLCTILTELNRIYTMEDMNLLKFLYIKSKVVEVDFFSSISLESAIRKEFAKIYSDTLYKVEDKHSISNDTELKRSNKEVYDKLNDLTYNGKQIPVYVMDGDFRLQIHALGAYRDWNRPDNFKDDWERPKIAYHGICTSYIANNLIANARAKHPILGFDNYSSNSLLCAGNYDLFSDYAMNRYDTAMYKPYTFYLPDDMIDNTRHTHNEMVLERRSNNKNGSFKRLPNYVVMLVDDINNTNNYDGELWDEYCQAASDYGVPIVIVDRLKYAKLEKNKIDKYEEEFYRTHDEQLLSKMIVQFCNNMIGCTCFNPNDEKEYHKIFTKGDLSDLVNRLFDDITKIQDDRLKLSLIKELCLVLEKEKAKGGYVPTFERYISLLNDAGISLVGEGKKDNLLTDEVRFINEYYYNSSEEVQTRIEEEFNNGVSPEVIAANIKIGVYERRMNK
jgi:hypothetical protein